MPPLTIILTLVATGAAVTIALIFLADARDWRRMLERMQHQRALADVKPWGDVVELPIEAKQRAANGSPGGGAGYAARAQVARHIAHDSQAPTR